VSDPLDFWRPAAAWPGPDRAAIDVWLCPLRAPRPVFETRYAHLDTAERARAVRFHRDVDREAYVLTRGLLRERLAALLALTPSGVPLTASARGKPELAAPSPRWEFNVSHSGDFALVAFAWDRRIGIDLELARQPLDGPALARQFFSLRENRALAAAPGSERTRWFYAIWTRKESFLKATGDGLSFPLDGFSVTPSPAEAPQLLELAGQSAPGERWRMWDLPVPAGYAAALTAEGPRAAEFRGWR